MLWTSYASVRLVEREVVVVVELAGCQEGKMVARVRDQRVDNQARIPGDLLLEGGVLVGCKLQLAIRIFSTLRHEGLHSMH